MKSLTTKIILFTFIVIGISEVQSQQEIGPTYYYKKRLSEDILPTENVPSEVIFPQENPNYNDNDINNNQIPLDVFKMLQNISSIEDFLQQFGDENHQQATDDLSSQFAGIDLSRQSVRTPKQAICKPMDSVVELKPNNSSSAVLYFPSCTVLKRCGGCCGSSLLQCEPTKTQMINFVVLKNSAFGNGQFQKMSKDLVTVEQHDECLCRCRVKEHHCNKYQKYDANNCVCNCLNLEEKNKCYMNHLKIWMPENCTCVCRKYEICTTGLHFDTNECKCTEERTQLFTRNPTDLNNRRQFILKPIFLDPDSKTTYNTEG